MSLKGVKILVVDDEEQMRRALDAVLKRKGYEVELAIDGAQGLKKIKEGGFSAMITDVKMPGMSGIELLRAVHALDPNIKVLVMTAYGTIEDAIEAMKQGASDYILKPFPSQIIESALGKALIEERGPVKGGLKASDTKMKEILKIAGDIASTTATVLITGDSGTGKELLARYIFELSDRQDRPFVSVNCASIPEGLLESELFGHEKGAFTGALVKRIGKFEQADGGTLLLDEIGEMSLVLQAKLLRVLQEREIDRVGGKEPIKIDIRVIATTNKDLKVEVAEKRFREDLFYRLNVFPFVLPKLSSRPDDIRLLSEHFLTLFAGRYKKEVQNIDTRAMDSLLSNPWRGNVRELENVMERAVLMSTTDTLSFENLYYGEEPALRSDVPLVADKTIKEMEKELILLALKDTGGNKTKAAKKLGISIRTLRNKLKEYRVEEESSL